jgi:hypothetical protein
VTAVPGAGIGPLNRLRQLYVHQRVCGFAHGAAGEPGRPAADRAGGPCVQRIAGQRRHIDLQRILAWSAGPPRWSTPPSSSPQHRAGGSLTPRMCSPRWRRRRPGASARSRAKRCRRADDIGCHAAAARSCACHPSGARRTPAPSRRASPVGPPTRYPPWCLFRRRKRGGTRSAPCRRSVGLLEGCVSRHGDGQRGLLPPLPFVPEAGHAPPQCRSAAPFVPSHTITVIPLYVSAVVRIVTVTPGRTHPGSPVATRPLARVAPPGWQGGRLVTALGAVTSGFAHQDATATPCE